MKEKIHRLIGLALAALFLLVGCTNGAADSEADDGKLRIVATNSILADMVKNVGGDLVHIHSIVPVGTDPHEHEILPEDTREFEKADIIFHNALNLETGGGWFDRLIDTTHREEGVDSFAVTKNVEPIYLEGEDQQGKEDPHAWLDLQNGIKYVEVIRDVLKDKDEANADTYEQNAAAYIEKLNDLDQQYKDSFSDIPEEKRLLITSEGAFKYFAKAYGLDVGYIWEINTEEQGTPEQFRTIIDKIKSSDVPALFVETSVDPRSMERLSKETGLPIAATIYTDSVGSLEDDDPDIQKEKEDFAVDTYYGMVHWDLEKIHQGLSQ